MAKKCKGCPGCGGRLYLRAEEHAEVMVALEEILAKYNGTYEEDPETGFFHINVPAEVKLAATHEIADKLDLRVF